MNKENIRWHITDTLEHQSFFIKSCMKMLDYLYAQDRYEDAIELARRCSAHDCSKLHGKEFLYFLQLHDCKPEKCVPNGILSEEQRKIIESHWKKNRHHPEHFSDYHEMTEIDIMEMVVDWKARSCQFGTDFMKFVNTVPQSRFGFDNEFFGKVLKYCEVIDG